MNEFALDETKLDAFCSDGSLMIQNGFACGDWNEEGKGILQIRPFNVTNLGSIELNTRKYIETHRKIDPYVLRRRDVIFNNTNSEELVGKTALWNREECTVLSNHMTILRVLREDRLSPEFLSYYLLQRWFDRYFHSVCRRHVNQASVSIEQLRTTAMPDFEVSEQRKIAAVLGLVQRAIEQQERMIALTTELKKALLHKLFSEGLRGEPQKVTEIGPVPESWEVVKIGSLGQVITGTTPKTKVPEYYSPPEVDFIAPADLGQTREIYNSERKISRQGLGVIRSLPKDAVMCVCIGSSIGKVGMTSKASSATNQQINSIVCSERHDPPFVYYLLSYLADYWRGFATFGPVPILSKGSFEAIDVVAPRTKDEEVEIAQCFTALDAKMEVHTQRKNLLTDLFRSMLHQLMTAQIRVHDLDVSELEKMGTDDRSSP